MEKPIRRQRGVTLIELMFAITVAAVLLGVGIPSYQTLVADNRRAATVNALVTGIHLARTSAYSANRTAVICPTGGGNTCVAAADWASGWIVFIDDDADGVDETTDGNDQVDAGEEILSVHGAVPNGVTVSAGTDFWRFRRNTQATNNSIEVCSGGTQRNIVVSALGFPRLEIPDPDTC